MAKSVGRPRSKCLKRSVKRGKSTKPRCKSTKRKSMKRKTVKRKTVKRKSMKKKTVEKSIKKKTVKRKSPGKPLALAMVLKEGTKRKGRDGHYYKVMINDQGQHVWRKCGGDINCRYSRIIGPMPQ